MLWRFVRGLFSGWVAVMSTVGGVLLLALSSTADPTVPALKTLLWVAGLLSFGWASIQSARRLGPPLIPPGETKPKSIASIAIFFKKAAIALGVAVTIVGGLGLLEVIADAGGNEWRGCALLVTVRADRPPDPCYGTVRKDRAPTPAPNVHRHWARGSVRWHHHNSSFPRFISSLRMNSSGIDLAEIKGQFNRWLESLEAAGEEQH